jgi:rhamnulokinase
MVQLVAPESTAEVVALSNGFGSDPSFVRAGGGNSSIKIDGVLWIKPSGVPLATLAADDLVPLDRARLLALMAQDPATLPREGDPVMAVAAEARLGEAHGRRPSVELLFHALLPERLVLHTHPIHVNGVTCNAGSEALARRLFGDRAVWVPYTDPGLPLAHAIVAARASHTARTGRPAPRMTLLGNHGLIVGGETAADIDAETAWLVGVIEAELASRPEVVLDASAPAAAEDSIVAAISSAASSALSRPAVVFDADPVAATWCGTGDGRAFMAGGPLIPDQIVYTGSWPAVADAAGLSPAEAAARVSEAIAQFTARRGVAPIIAIVPGVGLFATGDTQRQAETARDVYLDMLRTGFNAVRLGGVRHMNDAERTFIEQWEAEAYRRQVASGA